MWFGVGTKVSPFERIDLCSSLMMRLTIQQSWYDGLFSCVSRQLNLSFCLCLFVCFSANKHLISVSQHLQLCHYGWRLPRTWLVLTHAAVVISGRSNHSLGVSFLCNSVILADTYWEAILRAILKPFAVLIGGKILRHFEINLHLWHHWLKMRCLLVLAILQLLFI